MTPVEKLDFVLKCTVFFGIFLTILCVGICLYHYVKSKSTNSTFLQRTTHILDFEINLIDALELGIPTILLLIGKWVFAGTW